MAQRDPDDLAAEQLEQQLAALEDLVRRAAAAADVELKQTATGWRMDVPNLARAAIVLAHLPDPPEPR